jgi:trimeric autotransporter adhesin
LNVTQSRLGANQLLTVDVAASPGVDLTATAATVNVTAVAPATNGFLSVLPGPCATVTLPPSTSNLNMAAGRNAAASATVGLGDGQLCVYSSTDTDVVVDLQALHGAAGGEITAVDPQRLVDTRLTTRLVAGQSLPLDLPSVTAAVIVNLTAVAPSGPGFLTLYPCGSALPTVSNLNVVAGAIVANRGVASTGGTSQFCLFTSVSTDVVIDVEGFVSSS